MNIPAFAMLALCLSACSARPTTATPETRAANACETETKARIGDKPHQLDTAALLQSAQQVDGIWLLRAPIVVNPGLRNEAKQTLECKVRVQDGNPDEVTYINFIF